MEEWSLLGKGTFLPVHWATFSRAMHAWDDPAETLLALGPKRGVPLAMPRLGEPVERASPWWGAVERKAPAVTIEEPAGRRIRSA